jgi:diphthine-ammonia ligase
LSTYQKNRVENVCERLNLKSLAYLWERDQLELLDEMIESDVHAVLIKIACIGTLSILHFKLCSSIL